MNLETRTKNIILILLLVLACVVVYFAAPKLRFQVAPSGVLAVSNINISPQGTIEPNGAVINDEWIVTATTYASYATHCFYEFNASQVQGMVANGHGTDTVQGETVLPKSSIELNVTTGTPYLESTITSYNELVIPPAYGMEYVAGAPYNYKLHEYYNDTTGTWVHDYNGPIPAQNITCYVTSGNWYIVIPLNITATKISTNGVRTALVGPNGATTYSITSSGAGQLLPVTFTNPQNSSESLTFQLDGMLGSGLSWSPPTFFMLGPTVKVWSISGQSEASSILTNYIQAPVYNAPSSSYSTSFLNAGWYGSGNWGQNPDGSVYVAVGQNDYTEPNGYPGIYPCLDTGFPTGEEIFTYPIAVTYNELMYSGTPYAVASGRPNSLTAYLNSIPSIGFNLSPSGINPYYPGQYAIVGNQFRLYASTNDYLWEYSLSISTQLADTYVYSPSFPTMKMTGAVWQSGESIPSISVGGYDSMMISVENTGTAPGSGVLKFTVSPSNALPYCTIVDTTTPVINAGNTVTVPVAVTNTGGETSSVTITITITLYNQANVQQGGTLTLQAILTPSSGVNTYLTVQTENTNVLALSGMDVTVTYGTASQMGVTSSGTCTFNLEMYTGKITISAVDPTGAYQTTTVKTAVPPLVCTITMLREGQAIPWYQQYFWLIFLIIIAAIIIAFIIYYRKTRLRR